MKATTALPFNTLFSRESPEAIPAKIGAWVTVILVACHLYPRSGTSPTEDFCDKAHVCGLIKLYVLQARRKAKDEELLGNEEGDRLIAADRD